jgi:hypothetical protein
MRYEYSSGGSPTENLSTDTWVNNALYDSAGGSPLHTGPSYPDTAQTWAYWAANAFVFSGNIGTGTTDPMLTAWNTSWFTTPDGVSKWNPNLQAGSPAIGTGLGANAPTTDITGLVRNSPPGIGAYQFTGTPGGYSPCDLNYDGVVNVLDVVLAINQVIGSSACTNGNLGAGACTVADVQSVIGAAVGGACAQ